MLRVEELDSSRRIVREREIDRTENPPREEVTELAYDRHGRLVSAGRRGSDNPIVIRYGEDGSAMLARRRMCDADPHRSGRTARRVGELQRRSRRGDSRWWEVTEWTEGPRPTSRQLERTYDAQGRLVRSRVVIRSQVTGDAPMELVNEAIVEYSYEGCGDSAPPSAPELGHEATFETPLDIVPP